MPRDTYGLLLQKLAAAAVSPDEIDTLWYCIFIPTILVALIGADGDLVFKNAPYYVPE